MWLQSFFPSSWGVRSPDPHRRVGRGTWLGLTRVSLPVQGLQAPNIVLEHLLGPPGVSHGLPWRPGLHSQGFKGQGLHNCGPPSEDISVRWVSTSKELTCNKQWKEELVGGITAPDKWLSYKLQMAKLHNHRNLWEAPSTYTQGGNISFPLLCVTCKSQINIWGTRQQTGQF